MLYRAFLISLLVAATGASFPELPDPSNDLPNYLAMQPPRQGDLYDVRFLLWTRSNPEDVEYYRLLPDDLDNLESPLVPTLPTCVMFHGFNDDGLEDWITQAKTGVLN